MRRFYVNWQINSFCNFLCPYCWISENDRKDPNNNANISIKNAIKFFDSLPESLINLTGGEAFLFKDFIKLCKVITRNHFIGIATNLSSDKIYDFAEKINPKKVTYISASLHLTELNKLNQKEQFIKRYKFLKEKGFNIYVSIVMWPPIFKKFDKIYNEFEKVGIHIIPISFGGIYKEKSYPDSYSKNEINIMKKYSRLNYSKNSNLIEDFYPNIRDGKFSFKGNICKAGNDYIVIKPNGDILRCFSDTKNIIGNIYKDKKFKPLKSSLCNLEECGCPWEGYNYCLGKPRIIKNIDNNKKNNKNKSAITKIIEEFIR